MTILVKEIGGTGNATINGTAPNSINVPADTWNGITSGLIRAVANEVGTSGTGGFSMVNGGSTTQKVQTSINFNGAAGGTAEARIILNAQNKTVNPVTGSTNDCYLLDIRPNSATSIRMEKNVGGNVTVLGNFSTAVISNNANISVTFQATTAGNVTTLVGNLSDGNATVNFLNTDSSVIPGTYFGVQLLNSTGGFFGNISLDNLATSSGFFQLARDLNGLGVSGTFFANPLV